MEFGVGLLILALLALPVAAIAALTVALGQRGRVERLESRIGTLERALAALSRQTAPRPEFSDAPGTQAWVAPATPLAAPKPSAADAPPEPAPPPRSTEPPPQATPPRRSLEERLGARWSVIVGGLALALGGVFLVRYSIEQGLLGPAARIALGALFSALLLGLGERIRRAEAARGAPRRAIDIPATLTAAGGASAFAAAYAAYALYGFLGDGAAFVLLGVVAVSTLLGAALHGPILGALGLIGAYGVPLLVSSDAPDVGALFLYLLAPTGAAFAVARLRTWPMLALAAGLAAFAWGVLAVGTLPEPIAPAAILLYAAALTALAALLHAGFRFRAPPPRARPDAIASSLVALYGLMALAALHDHGTATLAAVGLLIAADLALGVVAASLAPVTVAAGVLTVLAALSFDDAALRAIAETTSFPTPDALAPARTAGVAAFLSFTTTLGVVFLGGGALGARTRPATPGWWGGLVAGAAVGTPLALIAVAYVQIADFAPDLRFAAVAVLIAGAFAALTEDAARGERAGATGPAVTAAFASGAATALGFALAMAMREAALTVALAFLAAALGFVATARPIRALGVLATAAAALVLLRVALDPKIVGDELSATPVFNALLWGYGAPAVAFWTGSRLFDRARQPLPAQVLEGLALLFALLLGFAQARHFAHGGVLGGDLGGDGIRLREAGLDATVAFGLASLAGRLSLKRASPVLAWGATAAAVLGLGVATLGLLFGANPIFTGEPVGDGDLLNNLLPGYLVPALAAAAAARLATTNRPAWFRRALGGAALVLTLAWATLTVRRVFAGPALSGGITGDGEWYAYSAVWLVFGLALLAAGVVRRSQMLRLASALVVVAVVSKVFLFDMASLGGVWRALSFIGLGGVLLGIGVVYQRLLVPRAAPDDSPSPMR